MQFLYLQDNQLSGMLLPWSNLPNATVYVKPGNDGLCGEASPSSTGVRCRGHEGLLTIPLSCLYCRYPWLPSICTSMNLIKRGTTQSTDCPHVLHRWCAAPDLPHPAPRLSCPAPHLPQPAAHNPRPAPRRNPPAPQPQMPHPAPPMVVAAATAAAAARLASLVRWWVALWHWCWRAC